MTLTGKDLEDLRRHFKEKVDNYPNLDEMLTNGDLTYKAGWYEPQNKKASDAIAPYASEIRVSKNGKAQCKVPVLSKRLKGLAEKC